MKWRLRNTIGVLIICQLLISALGDTLNPGNVALEQEVVDT